MYDTCRKCIYKGDINACCKADCTAHNSWFSQQIIDALTELLDGQFEDDIRRTTGLPENRCKEIYQIHTNLMNMKG